MLSIVICSINPEELSLVQENIRQTVGVPHEIIAFDNRIEKKGICEIYNAGTQRASYDIICYMHEDVEIRTANWGQVVLDIFSNDHKIGVLGVAGGGYKSLSPSGWYQVDFQSDEKSYQNVLQGYKYDKKNELHAYHNPRNERLSRVVCIDGLWFCTRKQIAAAHPFDSKTLKAFHGYDIDFCLSVFFEYKIMVTFDILMKHSSEGNFNKMWLNEILKLHRKWNKILPLTTSDLTEKEIYFIEKRSFKNRIEEMLEWGYSFSEIQRMIFLASQSRKMPVRLFLKAYLHLIKLKLNLVNETG